MKLLAAVALSATTLAACGGGPTAPKAITVDAQQSTGSPQPSPSPGPTSPTPAPSPGPAPTPNPPPTSPAPAPNSDMWHGSASTSDALWHVTPAPVSGTFQIRWDRQTITFGDLTANVTLWQETNGSIGIFAKANGLNLQIVFNTSTGAGTWTLSGEPGQASGTLAVEN